MDAGADKDKNHCAQRIGRDADLIRQRVCVCGIALIDALKKFFSVFAVYVPS